MEDVRDPMRIRRYCVTLVAITFCAPVFGQRTASIPGIRVHLTPASYHIPLGRSVWALFAVENTTDEPITLTVPGTAPQIPSPEIGLPLSHVFSGGGATGVAVTTASDRRWETPLGFRAPDEAPILIVAAHSTVGTSLDLREYFPALRGAGQFRLTWRPYKGAVESETVVITIAARKRAELVTDDGTMTLQFLYDEAPAHVSNFIELVTMSFYSGTTFHRIEPGYFLLGGCSRGDGTGIRPDGKRIAAEFNAHPHQKGSVSMALLGDDPDSASSQFFICNTRQKDWDGRYTVFAQLVGEASFETLDRMMATPTDETGRPRRTLYIRSVRLIEEPPDSSSDTP